MSRNSSGNPRNLNYEDRCFIEQCLKDGLKFKDVAVLLIRNPKTISNEIKNRRFAHTKDPEIKKTKCAFLKDCSIIGLCSNKYCRKNIVCSKCKLRTCSQYCDKYVPGTCPKLLKPPYVCNGCKHPRTCGYDKMYYRAKYADDQYHEAMSESRTGINMTPEELQDLDNLLTPLLKKGQSIAHIYATHSTEINCSKRTLYTYVDSGVLTARNIDLPRQVRYKPRKKHRSIKENPNYRLNRTYQEFLKYSEEHSDIQVVEMDTVIGSRGGGKVLLTMLFRQSNFMLISLLESNTKECVIDWFDQLEQKLGHERFKRIFPLILTDNGSEFKDPDSLEKSQYGDTRTQIYYCEPYKSWQKARIEKNHEFIRYVLPKGTTFSGLTQEKVTLMANHINSIARASLNNKSSFQLASMLLDKEFFEALGLHEIKADKVHLKPYLLK